MKRRRRFWSLTAELDVLADAIEAARILADAIAHEQLETEQDARRAPDAVSAVLVLAGLRVRELRRFASGDVDVETLRAQHNECEEDGLADRGIVFGGSRTARVIA